MTIQDLQNLDLYKCSLQDINKSFKGLGRHLQMMIKEGKANSNRFQELKKLHVLISRARKGMTADGFMMTYNTDIDRLPNSKSVL
jgi:hypothetical protein